MQPQYYRPARSPRPVPPRKHRGRHLVLFGLLIVVAVFAIHSWPHRASSSAAAETSVKKVAPYAAPSQTALTTMDSAINNVLAANSTVDISATIIDLTSGATRNYGPAVGYEAASTGKLITAVDTFQQVEAGTMHMSDTLEDGNSVSYDLRIMIVNSDDNAWQSLNDRLGEDSIEDTAQGLGISGYNLETNILQTTDIAGLLQKLYKGTILNASDRSLLMGYLKSANYRGYIVSVVPANVTAYHKVGILEDRIHDSAIIDNGSDPIVLVIFTNGHGTYDFQARTAAIQQITTAALTGYDIK